MKTKILIIGTGAIGSFYGAKLSQAGASVTVLCRSDYKQVKQNGIFIESYLGDFHFTPSKVIKNTDEYQDQADFIIIATKSLPTINIGKLIQPVLNFGNNNASIVLLQNGIHIEKPIAELFPHQHLISIVAFIAVSKVAPAYICHQSFGKIIIGDYPSGISEKSKLLFELFEKSSNPCQLSENIKLERWKKLVWNIGFNPTSVLANRADTLKLLNNPALKIIITKVMQEVKTLAEADGCKLPENIIEENIENTKKMPAYKTSMLLDFEAKRAMEIEAILGNALRFAKEKNIEVPFIESFYGLLSCY